MPMKHVLLTRWKEDETMNISTAIVVAAIIISLAIFFTFGYEKKERERSIFPSLNFPLKD